MEGFVELKIHLTAVAQATWVLIQLYLCSFVGVLLHLTHALFSQVCLYINEYQLSNII